MIGAYFEKVKGKLVLKIALNKKRRAWFSGLWNYSGVFDFPFKLSNAQSGLNCKKKVFDK
jgi:hypothetical protein